MLLLQCQCHCCCYHCWLMLLMFFTTPSSWRGLTEFPLAFPSKWTSLPIFVYENNFSFINNTHHSCLTYRPRFHNKAETVSRKWVANSQFTISYNWCNRLFVRTIFKRLKKELGLNSKLQDCIAVLVWIGLIRENGVSLIQTEIQGDNYCH